MACLAGRIGFSGRTTEEMNCQFRRSWMPVEDNGGRRLRSPGLCSARLGRTVKCGLSVDGSLKLAPRVAKRKNGKKTPVTSPQIDQLMEQSVYEIVRNINKAPFLVHLYSDADGDSDSDSPNGPQRVVIEKSTSDNWPFIKQRWDFGDATPNGVILVQELSNEDEFPEDEQVELTSSSDHCCTTSKGRPPPSSTKVWGLLVQGRGATCPACYILKTCRVECCFGFTTHFCLAKIDCLGMSTDYHLNRMWLQR